MAIDKTPQVGGNRFENEYVYTQVNVKDKDSGKTFPIQMVNSQIEGNAAKWKIENGKVYIYDSQTRNYKPVDDNTLEVTRYQAAILKAAAEAGDGADKSKLNEFDLCGSAFGERVDAELGKAQSEYKVRKYDEDDPYSYDADASGNTFVANVQNANGDKGRLKITINTEPDANPDAYRKPSIWSMPNIFKK